MVGIIEQNKKERKAHTRRININFTPRMKKKNEPKTKETNEFSFYDSRKFMQSEFFVRLAMAKKPLFIILRNSDRDNTENSKNVLVLVPLLWQNCEQSAYGKQQDSTKNKVFANQMRSSSQLQKERREEKKN